MSHAGMTVGITVQMVDRFSGGLKSIGSNALHAGVGVDKLKERLKGVQERMAKFNALGNIGRTMESMSASFFEPVIKHGNEYVHVLNQMNMSGLQQAEIAKNITSAWQLAGKNPMTTPTENLQTLMELKNFFVDSNLKMDEARILLPDFAKAKSTLMAAAEHMGFDGGGETYAMAKALEMRGTVNDPHKFRDEIRMMTATMVATSGKVLPSDYQMVNKYARIGKIGFDTDFLYKHLPELIMENKTRGGGGASSVGTGLQAIMRMGVQGVMNQVTAENLRKIGMLPHAVMKTTTTGTVIKEKGAVLGSDLLQADPYRWVNEILVPHMVKARGKAFANAKEMQDEISRTIKGPGTTVGLIGEMANKEAQIKRFANIVNHLKDADQLFEMAKNDPGVANVALNKSLDTLYTAFGQHVTPVLVPLIMQLAQAIVTASTWLREHKGVTQGIMAFMAAIGLVGGALAAVAAIASTAIMVIAAGIGSTVLAIVAWIAAAVAAVTGIIFALMNWGIVCREANRIFRQGQVVFEQVGMAFRSLLAQMLSGIAAFAAGAAGSLAALSNGLVKIDTSALTKAAADYSKSVKADNAAAQSRINAANHKAPEKSKITPIPRSGNYTPIVHDQSVRTINLTVNDGDIHKVRKVVHEELNSLGKKAARSQTTAGGAYTSSHHGGGR